MKFYSKWLNPVAADLWSVTVRMPIGCFKRVQYVDSLLELWHQCCKFNFSFTEVFRILHFLLVHFILCKIICLIIVIILVSIWCYYTVDNNIMIMNCQLSRCSWKYTEIIWVILFLLLNLLEYDVDIVGCDMPDLSSGILTVPVFRWRLFFPLALAQP